MWKKLSTALTITLVFAFALRANQSLAQTLYTMTTQGGNFTGKCNNDVPQCGLGMILKYNIATDSITGLFDFTDSTGYIPDGYMMLAGDGNLYGLTTIGGLNALSPDNVVPSGGAGFGGTLFQYNPQTNVFTVEQNLDSFAVPGGAMIQARDGNLYGLTGDDGDNYSGTLFQYNYTNSTYRVMQSLPDSAWPGGCTLVEASDSNLYGLTTGDGANFSGTLFQYNYRTNTYTVKEDLPSGAWPYGSVMVEGPDSNLYGITLSGGSNSNGFIFQYNYKEDTFIVKQSLPRDAHYSKGYYGSCVLALASDSNMYGMTYGDGTHNSGTIFQYNYRTNTYTPKYSLPDSAWPWGSLMQASDSNLYGYTQYSGPNHKGTLFQFNYRTDSFTVKVNFDGTNGAFPIYNRLLEDNIVTGIKQLNAPASGTSVYPDPTPGQFTLRLPEAIQTGTVEIYNMLGARIYATTSQPIPASSALDISPQPAGVYFITVQDGSILYCTKVVKE